MRVCCSVNASPTLLQIKYARVIELFAAKADISVEEALDLFYRSNTYHFMREGVSDMHARSDGYLADELMIEYGLAD